jgi:hypothetical protein
MHDVETIVAELRGPPIPTAEAKGLLPAEPGFYAWWVQPDAIPSVPNTAHPSSPWSLFYVGIAPGRDGSSATLASRIGGQHIGGNTGSSTFRLSLASLLFEDMGWQPLRRQKKVVLSSADNTVLRQWQEEHAALRWAVVRDPWSGDTEAAVIKAMMPPLNLAANAAHPFHSTMSDARRRFHTAAI